ncbi:MAG: GatB/YqeY domain-containing protein [Bacteroidaceae bacterium]|nr:GatB/YqeY domain-containing protein [Bacteroidaceae bacterium]
MIKLCGLDKHRITLDDIVFKIGPRINAAGRMQSGRTAVDLLTSRNDEDAIKIIQKLVKQGRESAELYQSQNRTDLAAEELAQVAIMEKYLPAQMSEEEISAAIKDIITELGVSTPKEMGKVMGVATKRLAGKADGRAISTIVKKLLG